MSGGNIKEKYKDIKSRLDEARLLVKTIEGELLGLQHVCDHKNTKSNPSQCLDCGKHFYTSYMDR